MESEDVMISFSGSYIN